MHYTSDDSFAASFLIAIGLHAFVLLGMGFVFDFKPLTHPLETLDVVMVNWQSETPPDEADFLAQAAQRGGGESTEDDPFVLENADSSLMGSTGEDTHNQQEESAPVKDATREQLLVEAPDMPLTQQITSIAQPKPPTPSAASLRQASMEMARRQSGVQGERPSQSKLPRRKWISANTREYEFAAYMRAWVAKVERVGNLNYPEEVRRRKLVGDVLMTVGINRDGSVESIDIRRSSGLPELDQAAARIVRLAAPYSPLPDTINTSIDVLHITRTWVFSRDFRGLN